MQKFSRRAGLPCLKGGGPPKVVEGFFLGLADNIRPYFLKSNFYKVSVFCFNFNKFKLSAEVFAALIKTADKF